MNLNTSWAGRLLSLSLPGLVLLGLLVIWEAGTVVSGIEKWILPAPSLIAESLWEQRALLTEHTMRTLLETALGLTAAVMLSVVIATFLDVSEWLRKAVYPILVVSQTVPIIAIAPLFMIWFGYGILPKVIIVALVCFFPITINLAEGYRYTDKDMIRLMETMGAGRMQIFRMVKLPAALPYFFSGLRIAGTYSVMGAVIGEWLGANKGLGIYLTRASQSYLTERVFAAIFVIVVLSLVIFGIIELLGRLMMPWHQSKQQS
ncbi:ABC transporter permease [Bacillus marinisedimentorum]|uniref:ABC transporter permease n=1 Tax=Bacillus marinisedimentorum TaxID=1821260 RepID=UPI001FDFD5BB|nr:ABC transporter permease [Bacillus marinisedimentorum]